MICSRPVHKIDEVLSVSILFEVSDDEDEDSVLDAAGWVFGGGQNI